MTKADEKSLEALLSDVRNMESATAQKNNKEEIEKIRQYCIDAVRDYEDTIAKICALMNRNRDLFNNCRLEGFVTEDNGHGTVVQIKDRVSGTKYSQYQIKQALMWVNDLRIVVDGVTGMLLKDGYCMSWQDHLTSKDKWVAVDILAKRVRDFGKPENYNNDLLEVSSCSTEIEKGYTIERLKTLSTTIEQWSYLKARADRTRNRSLDLVNSFKKALEDRVVKARNQLNKLEQCASSNYERVSF